MDGLSELDRTDIVDSRVHLEETRVESEWVRNQDERVQPVGVEPEGLVTTRRYSQESERYWKIEELDKITDTDSTL